MENVIKPADYTMGICSSDNSAQAKGYSHQSCRRLYSKLIGHVLKQWSTLSTSFACFLPCISLTHKCCQVHKCDKLLILQLCFYSSLLSSWSTKTLRSLCQSCVPHPVLELFFLSRYIQGFAFVLTELQKVPIYKIIESSTKNPNSGIPVHIFFSPSFWLSSC